jgi:small-conductance mechanosensitive channel
VDIKTKDEHKIEQEKIQRSVAPHVHKVWIGTYAMLSAGCLATYFLLRWKSFQFIGTYQPIFIKLSLAGFFSFVMLIVAKITERIVTKRSHTKGIKYNVVRLIRLLTFIIITFIIISFLNENWYTAAVSLGLISLLLGFALQSPIASLIGWFYILIRSPYKVGDRIQIQAFTGDVVEINYFDTTLWEIAGNYMTNDLPSGRLIRFPNSFVWQYEVYNYSWKEFPYIWNEIPFYIGFQSDLSFVEETIREIALSEMETHIREDVQKMKEGIKRTPVDGLEIKDYPFVNFRVNVNTWVEVLLIYLVEPKKAAEVRSNFIKKILLALAQQPEKVLLPKGDSR